MFNFFAPADGTQAFLLESLIHNLDGWTDLHVVDMNNLGQIVGNGTYNGMEQAFILNLLPNQVLVPEPGLLAILALLAFAGGSDRLRRRLAHGAARQTGSAAGRAV